MTYPASDVNTTNTDVTGDNPQLARVDILDLMTKFNLLRNHITTLGQTLLNRATAALMRTDLGAAASGANADITSLTALASINGRQVGGNARKNINGDFSVNQLGLTSPVTLAAGEYGHDGWFGGASGCTYSFTTTGGLTTITITAGSLKQTLHGKYYSSNTHIMSWIGTSQGSLTGGYSASGVTGTLVGGANTTIEFATGTLTKVQVELGAIATAYEFNHDELWRCKEYWQPLPTLNVDYNAAAGGHSGYQNICFEREFWAVPTMSGIPTAAGGNGNNASQAFGSTTRYGTSFGVVSTAAGRVFFLVSAGAFASARL